MRIEEAEDRIAIDAPAKLNLFLEVLFRREDGFHELDTVIQEIDLCDRLEFRPADRGVRVVCSDRELPAGRENIVHRAAEAVLREAEDRRGVEIALTKRIPVGGGLGGGSSDAAATIVGVDRLYRIGLGREVRDRLARDLGSDVPFFLCGGAARCRGRGEKVEPIPAAAAFDYVVLWPGFLCSTKEVYHRFRFALTPKKRDASLVTWAIVSAGPRQLGMSLFNRLEQVVTRIHPELSDIRRTLDRFPFLGVGMSGSGSCLYGLIDPARATQDLPEELREATGCQVFRVRGVGREVADDKE